MMITGNFDAVIIGAGPGGTATAIQCAQAGLKVAIFEAQAFPRHCPGETLHPGIEPLLKQLGVIQAILDAGFLRHQGNWIQWEGERQFVPFGTDAQGNWLGFQALRADFDRILLDRAKDLGVTIIQPCRPSKLIIEQGHIRGVETSLGTFFSTFVVDATGRRHWLAQQLKLAINYYSPRLITSYSYARGNCIERYEVPSIVADEQGWTWIAKIQPNLYQWTRLNFQSSNIDSNWRPKEIKSLLQDKIYKADVTWRFVSPPAGKHYFLVGDAAFVLDPASSHGVLKAIMSGMMAGHLMIQAIKQDQDYATIAQIYCQWLTNWFTKDLSKLRHLYFILPKPPGWIKQNSGS